MTTRRFFLKVLGLLGIGSAPAVSGKVPRPSEWPAPPWGPWACVHDKGEHACNHAAFYALVKPRTGERMNPDEFRLLDGTTPKAGDPIICGSCGFNLGRERVFPLSVRQVLPRIAQPQPARSA